MFSTLASRYLAQQLGIAQGVCTIKQFKDTEWHVMVQDDVYQKPVWVLAQTGAPADNLIQLFLLCDALKRAGARLNICISYFGYARQDRILPGEALASEVMCSIINLFKPERVEVVHLHNPTICHPLLTSHIPFSFFFECIGDADVIVSPDKGARFLATTIADTKNKELIMLEKHRPEPEKATIAFQGDVTGKNVLIVDDMITTGGTIMQAAQLMFDHGARSVRVAATHCVFAEGALEALEGSLIEQVTVTNTLPQKASSDKLKIVNIAPFIKEIMSR